MKNKNITSQMRDITFVQMNEQIEAHEIRQEIFNKVYHQILDLVHIHTENSI